MQGIAGGLAVTGLVAAYLRYGRGRAERMEEAAREPSPLISFLANGWYFDNLYGFLFIRPYQALSGVLWQKVDEGVIDDSLDRLAQGLGWTGNRLGRWSTGRVAVYLISFAAGGAAILGYLAWTFI